MAEALAVLVNGALVLGLGLLLGGFLDRSPRSPLVRGAGWVLFASYWPFQARHFFEIADPVNAWFCILGPFALLYFAYHEWLSWKWKEDPPALRWLAGTSFGAAAVYFVFLAFPLLSKGLIYITAVQTTWMMKGVFGLDSVTGPSEGVDTHIFLVGADGVPAYAVTIILACTAIQSLMIFAAAIWCVKAPNSRRWKAALVTLPVIHVLNLFRNAGIVYGYKILEWQAFGIETFEWMHSYVGKFGSLAALIVLAVALFTLLPELHGNILDIFDLPKRKAKGFYDRPPKGPTAVQAEAAGAAGDG